MLCSMPSSGKGGSSKWLDRLRSNKGFPIPDNVLDSSTTPPPPTHNSDNSPSPSPSENPKPAAASSSFAVITGILSDLFYITPSSVSLKKNKKKKKKFPRKQSSPKILSTQQRPLPPPPPPLILSSNSHNAHQQHSDQEHDNPPHKQQLLHGFSKTEVTVIDTSSHLWKSDKLIFRRKHVWKIKDKNNNNHRHTPKHFTNNNFSPSQHRFLSNPHHQITPSNQEYNAEHCSGPEMSANAPDSSNDKKENAFTLLQENGSYDPEKSDQVGA